MTTDPARPGPIASAQDLQARIPGQLHITNPDYVVLGEPSNLHVRVGHRGRMEMEVNVQGRAAHASSPELGNRCRKMTARG